MWFYEVLGLLTGEVATVEQMLCQSWFVVGRNSFCYVQLWSDSIGVSTFFKLVSGLQLSTDENHSIAKGTSMHTWSLGGAKYTYESPDSWLFSLCREVFYINLIGLFIGELASSMLAEF